eukprot:1216016-Pyramimonas_sp.AAC.1
MHSTATGDEGGAKGLLWDAQRHTDTMCPPRRRASGPNMIRCTHLAVCRLASGAARKRPPRRMY